MDKKQIEGITRRIKEVDDFLRVARQTWTGRLVSSSYGLYSEKSLFMSTYLKNEVLDVIERYNTDLKEELEGWSKLDNKALEELKIIGSWVALETQKRKYKEKELKEVSDALQFLKKYLSNE